jgi:hypothetical protein
VNLPVKIVKNPNIRHGFHSVFHSVASDNLILILFGRFENAAYHMPFSSENPFLKISSSHFLASF